MRKDEVENCKERAFFLQKFHTHLSRCSVCFACIKELPYIHTITYRLDTRFKLARGHNSQNMSQFRDYI